MLTRGAPRLIQGAPLACTQSELLGTDNYTVFFKLFVETLHLIYKLVAAVQTVYIILPDFCCTDCTSDSLAGGGWTDTTDDVT